MKNTYLVSSSAGVRTKADLSSLQLNTIESGILLFKEEIAGSPGTSNYYLGLDKAVILHTDSVIDGGTY